MRTIVIRLDEQPLAVSLWQENQKTRELANLGSLTKGEMTSSIFLKKLESLGFDRATTKIVLEIGSNNFFVRDIIHHVCLSPQSLNPSNRRRALVSQVCFFLHYTYICV